MRIHLCIQEPAFLKLPFINILRKTMEKGREKKIKSNSNKHPSKKPEIGGRHTNAKAKT